MKRLSVNEEKVFLYVCTGKEPLSLMQIREAVNKKYHYNWKPQTVSTFLARIRKKGYLEMERKGRCCYYYPLIELDRYQNEKLCEVWEDVFNADADRMRDVLGNLVNEKEGVSMG